MKLEPTADRIGSVLRQRGYRITTQRRAVLKVVAESRDHFTPGAVFDRVRQEQPTIGLVTIYRMLEVLTELDLICRVHTEDTCRSYLVRGPSGHHHHIVCSACGRVADFTDCSLDTLQRRLTRETGFKIQGHLLEFSGLCRECVQNV